MLEFNDEKHKHTNPAQSFLVLDFARLLPLLKRQTNHDRLFFTVK